MNLAQSQTPFVFFFLFYLIIYNSSFVQCIHPHRHHQYLANSSVVLSLPLHPYSAIGNQHHHNYTELTLSRLASDIARINYINSKLQYAIRSNFSGRYTADQVFQPDTPRTALFPGGSGGQYLVRIGVGTPKKEFYLVADTGSGVTWLQCQPCKKCFKQYGPIFNPSHSSTFAPLRCSSPQCASLPVWPTPCNSKGCGFWLTYGDGSYSSGIFATETLTFGPTSVKGVAIGCGHDGGGPVWDVDSGFGDAAGILGLGAGSESFPSQIKASSFSYCPVDMNSKRFSTLEFNSAPPRDSIFVPMLRNPIIDTGYFYVGLSGITVGGALLPIPPSIFKINEKGHGGVILDSGTTLTLLASRAYKELKIALSKYTRGLPRKPAFSLFDTCYEITSAESHARFPLMGFVFSNGKTLSLSPNNYLRPVDSMGNYCLYFAETGPTNVIGVTQQEGMRITYDLANKRIGFSPNKC